ncbi:MAG: hypothetical protein MAG431_00852 [Chloroflexi bacterium]|nr:hypothetical protein [Chloroflexota bacterium]
MLQTILDLLARLLTSGFGNLAAYLAAHVLLCLLPAFYIAGAMTALIPKETVTRYLGRNTPKFISDPELSLQSILITASIIGRLKAWVYVFWVSIFSTLAGLIYGAWVDGASLGMVSLYLAGTLAFLFGALYLVNRYTSTSPISRQG